MSDAPSPADRAPVSTSDPAAAWTLRHRLLLGVVLLVGLLVRAVSLDHDLPDVYEEATPTRVAWAMWEPGGGLDPNPHFFHYPTLVPYVHVAAQAAFLGAGHLLGADLPPAGEGGYTEVPPGIILLGRWVTVAIGLGAILATARFGRAVAGARAGVWAAAALAVAPLHLHLSRTILVDGVVLLFVALALAECARVVGGAGRGAVLRAGVLVGLAASAKYSGALAGLAVALALVVRATHDHAERSLRVRLREGARALLSPPLLAAGGLAVVAFVLTSPYVVLDFGSFLDDFRIERRHMAVGHFGLAADGAGVTYLRTLWTGMATGWSPLALLGLVALGLSPGPRSRALPALGMGFLSLVLLSAWSMYAAHYVAPLLPILAVLAGFALQTARGWGEGRPHAERVRWGVVALGVVLAAAGAVWGVMTGLDEGRPHTRTLARHWVHEHARPGALIALEHRSANLLDDAGEGTRFHAVMLPLSVLEPERSAPFYDLRWYEGFDLVILSSEVGRRFAGDADRFTAPLGFYREVRKRWERVAKFEGTVTRGPRVEIYRNPAVPDPDPDASLPPGLLDRLDGGVRPVLSEFLSSLGTAYLARGWTRRAADLYAAAVEWGPDDPLAAYNLGALLVDQERYGEAAPLLERATALRPDLVAAHNNLGIARYQLGDLDGAIRSFEAALAREPDHPRAGPNLRVVRAERDRQTP